MSESRRVDSTSRLLTNRTIKAGVVAKKSIAQKSEKVKFLFKRSRNRKAELRSLYDRLMKRAEGREYISGVHDRHHIVPSSLEGPDDSSNIAILTFDEHFLAHYLLALTTDGPGRHSMLFAVNEMVRFSKNHKNRKVTRRQYAIARKALVEAASSAEHGKKISDGMSRRKEEMGAEAYATWCAERGKNTAMGSARRKNDMGEEAYAEWCAEKNSRTSAGFKRRKEEMSEQDAEIWGAQHGKKVSSGHQRRKEKLGALCYKDECVKQGKKRAERLKSKLGEEAHTEHMRAISAKGHETLRRRSPKVRCVNDGQVYAHASNAAKAYGLHNHAVHKVCQGKYKTTHGYCFEYVIDTGEGN